FNPNPRESAPLGISLEGRFPFKSLLTSFEQRLPKPVLFNESKKFRKFPLKIRTLGHPYDYKIVWNQILHRNVRETFDLLKLRRPSDSKFSPCPHPRLPHNEEPHPLEVLRSPGNRECQMTEFIF